MKSYTTVIKAGNSLTVTALTPQLKEIGVRRGDKVHVYTKKNKIIIEAIKTSNTKNKGDK